MNINNLTLTQLNGTVAGIEGYRLDLAPDDSYRPAADWSRGGPIIEREKIEIFWHNTAKVWCAANNTRLKYHERGEFVEGSDFKAEGPTLLVAAMRCFVLSQLGADVDVPEGLV